MADLTFYSDLDRLMNPTQNLGGGPGGQDASAIAQLILGGGQASIQDPNTGAMVPMIGPGAAQVPDATRAAVAPSFQRVLEEAERMAAGVQGKGAGQPSIAQPGQGNTLVANPYGPGSFDPTNPAAVAQVQQQAARQQELDKARGLIEQARGPAPVTSINQIMDELLAQTGNMAQAEQVRAKGLPIAQQIAQQREQAYASRQQAQAPIIKQILESVGLGGEDEFKKAFKAAAGKAAGEKALGKGGAINPKLMQSLGTEGFDKMIADEVGAGNIDATKQIQLERMHQQRLDKTMVQDPDRRVLTGTRGAAESLMRVKDAYEQTPAFKKGKVSDTFRTAMALSNAGAAVEQMAPYLSRLSPEERRFVAEYNTFSLNLRGVSQDSRFSNFDSQRVLQAVGNPIVGKDLYYDQVNSALRELQGRHDNIVDDLTKQGRRAGEFKKFSAAPAAPAVGTVQGGYVFKGGDPSKPESWVKQ